MFSPQCTTAFAVLIFTKEVGQLLTDFTWSVFEVIPESRCFIGTNLLLEQVKMVIKCSFYLGGCWVLNYAAADEENHIYVTNMRTHTKCKKACFSSF